MNAGSNETSLKGDLVVPERRIPVPMTISSQAQAFLAAPPPARETEEPDPEDQAAWRVYIDSMQEMVMSHVSELEFRYPAKIEALPLANASLYVITPENLAPEDESRAILYVHGGGFIVGGDRAAAIAALPLACASGCRVYSIDYRMPVDFPFPAGLDDVCDAYLRVLEEHRPENVAVFGVSAGGGLAPAMLIRMRDRGEPLPAAAVLFTPGADISESGDTYETNQHIDVVLKTRMPKTFALYANGTDLRDPELSPVFADYTKGFPPTLLISGTRDILLSTTVIMHRALRRAGIEADLHVFEAMPHAGFRGAPEDAEVLAEQVRFITERLGR
ncbi:acetyl esterase/lipase [Stenotrophomonas rhizophila]|uniref:Acetyl esterase/lipase n=1 Tax=Stenotrophomonas rhizophila TaxID=216778 RepID=A0A498CH99_9GAMM|nr:acetyl esterase/lipase [Stenotrophomonas rhizophila]